jgi:3-phenylpropionate/trans-cinnamate dioxygenase ferredoxin reductase subunit
VADRHVDFLLIGGGLASVACATELRRGGAEGSLLIVGREPDAPYDRPPGSKGYLRGEQSREDVLLHPPQWYEQRSIEVLSRVSAMKLNLDERTVKLAGQGEVGFAQALIATGANVRRLNVPGSELEGIHYLRTLGNADAIREDASGKRVVIVGGSYLGTELAASLTTLGCQCTVAMLEDVVLSRGFGDSVGHWFQSVLEERGVSVHGGCELEAFEGADGRVSRVVVSGGRSFEADAVVVAAGAVPDVMLARGAGLELGSTGGVHVDRCLRTAAAGVFAAGDMAEYDSVLHGRAVRIEHWDVALRQGKTAARNMLGREQPHEDVPYFFSDIGDWAALEYVGLAEPWAREVVRGSFDEGAFSVFYLGEGGRVTGALAVGRSEDLVAARRLIAERVAVAEPDARGDLSTDLATLVG